MKHCLAVVILALTVPNASLLAQAGVIPTNGAERAYMSYVAAWKAKDLPALKLVIADDYMTMNGEKKVSHKADELKEAESNPAYDIMHVDEMHSVVVKDTAVVSTS